MEDAERAYKKLDEAKLELSSEDLRGPYVSLGSGVGLRVWDLGVGAQRFQLRDQER